MPVPPQQLKDRGVTDNGNCDMSSAELKELAKAGQKTVVCDEKVSSPPQETKSLLRGRYLGASAIQPIPQWCTDRAFEGWFFYRLEMCSIENWRTTVRDTNTQQIVGTMTSFQLSYLYSSPNVGAWAFQMEVRPYETTGLAVTGTTMAVQASCSGACNGYDLDFPTQPVAKDIEAEGEAIFESSVPNSGAIGRAFSSLTRVFQNPAWTPPLTNPVVVSPPVDFRCDAITPGNPNVGCVIAEYVALHIISMSGPNQTYVQHLVKAEASGMVGFYPFAPPLHRMTDEALSDLNGDTACPRSYVRPPGHTCDEYPFRSTHEGAFTRGGGGRTFDGCRIAPQLPTGVTGPNGYSACMINATHNSSGGGFLGSFYNQNRVIENDPFRVFLVT